MLVARGAAAALLLAACSGPARPAKPPPPPPAPKPVPVYELPARPEAPAFAMQCSGTGASESAGSAKVKVFDFDLRPLPWLDGGASAVEASLSWPARTPIDIHDLVEVRSADLAACWRWASAKLALGDTRLRVSFDVDEQGALSGLSIAPHEPDALVSCVSEALAVARSARTSARPAHATIDLQFELFGQPAWKKKPKRPRKPKAEKRGKSCTPVLEGASGDDIAVTSPIVINDFHESRVPTRGTRGRVMQLRIACNSVTLAELDKRGVRRAVASQNAALGACHRAAREREPALAGTLDLQFLVHVDGTITAEVGGAGDEELHTCVRDAMQAIWLGQQDRIVQVNMPLSLEHAADTDDPEELLARGDGERAMAIWGQRLLERPDAADACSWRAGMVRAAAMRAPWLYDPWVIDALDALVADAAARKPEAARACLAEVKDELGAMVGSLDSLSAFTIRWRELLDLIEHLLPVADLLDYLPDLRMMHAKGIALTDTVGAIGELRGIHTEESLDLADRLEKNPDVLRIRCGTSDL